MKHSAETLALNRYSHGVRSPNLFYNLRRSVPAACVEDFVTEALCWIVSTHEKASFALLQLATRNAAQPFALDRRWTWSTQRNYGLASAASRPDMTCESDDAVVLFEHKIDAPVVEGQLEEHRHNAGVVFAGKRALVVLVTRDTPTRTNSADACIRWRDIQTALDRTKQQGESSEHVDRFEEFLGLEGLGRVPGPCPSFWQACITSVRHGGLDGRWTYIDLGRKFVKAVLPDALANMANDRVGSDQLLLAALNDALNRSERDRAVWDVCRQFFPSYLLRSENRFGAPIRINDRQGRKFARGVIEEIMENGLPR